MVTENSNSCQNHRHHHRRHRHHHKHHRRHGRCKNNKETNVLKRLKKGVNTDTTDASTEEEGKSREVWEENSSTRLVCTNKQERKHHAGRVLRNRRYRQPFEDHRQTKRLFTPEIKRFLKSWLVRRRDHPYPSRDEKRGLAVQTGLTYIQICNWFANWRRKLKNAGSEAPHHTWGNLIKSYNTKAQGNVEQFSLCSDDSIWEENDLSDREHNEISGAASTVSPLSYMISATAMDHSYSALYHQNIQTSSDAVTMENNDSRNTSQNSHNEQCLNFTASTKQADMTSIVRKRHVVPPDQTSPGVSSKHKNIVMKSCLTDKEVCHELPSKPTIMQRDIMSSWQAKKFHRDIEGDSVEFGKHRTDVNIYTHTGYNSVIESDVVKNGCENLTRKSKRQKKGENRPLELSKWLESAAKFKPGQNYVAWSTKNATWQSSACEMKKAYQWNVTANDVGNYRTGGQHHREELDAAEALTRLSALHQ